MEARLACGEKGRRVILEKYNWEKDTGRMLDFLDTVVSRFRIAGPKT